MATESFGHEPVQVGGTPPNVASVCARCRWNYPAIGPCGAHQRYVPWPCTSALVLGLVRRAATS